MMNNNILLFLQTKDQTMIVYAEENTALYVIIRVGMVMFDVLFVVGLSEQHSCLSFWKPLTLS